MRALNKLQIPLYEVGLPIYRFQHQYPHPHSVQDQAEMETRGQNTRNDLLIVCYLSKSRFYKNGDSNNS